MYTRFAGATLLTLLLPPLAGGPDRFAPDTSQRTCRGLWRTGSCWAMDYLDDDLLMCPPWMHCAAESMLIAEPPAFLTPSYSLWMPSAVPALAFRGADDLRPQATSEGLFDSSMGYLRRDTLSFSLPPELGGITLRTQADQQLDPSCLGSARPETLDILDRPGVGARAKFSMEGKWPGANEDRLELAVTYQHNHSRLAADSVRSAFKYHLPKSWLPLPLYLTTDISADTTGGHQEGLALSASSTIGRPYGNRAASTLTATLGIKRQANAGPPHYALGWDNNWQLSERLSVGLNATYTPASSAWQMLVQFQISAPARSWRTLSFGREGPD